MERISYAELPRDMFSHLLRLEHYINNSGLPMLELEMVRLRVAQLNQCAYCVDQHHKELRHEGETELRLSSLVVWKETPYYSDRERAMLELTEWLTLLGDATIDDALFNRLLDHFSKEEIAYLSLAIAQIGTWTRLMKSFRFEPGKFQVKEQAA